MLRSHVQPDSLLIYLHLEQKEGRQRKAARTPTHHMLFLMIENSGCARRFPNVFLGPGACGTTAVVLLFPPVFSPPPLKSAAGKLRMLLLWYAFGRRLFCEVAVAAAYSPPELPVPSGRERRYGLAISGCCKPPALNTFVLIGAAESIAFSWFGVGPSARLLLRTDGVQGSAWNQQLEEAVEACHRAISSYFYKMARIQNIALLMSHSSRQ